MNATTYKEPIFGAIPNGAGPEVQGAFHSGDLVILNPATNQHRGEQGVLGRVVLSSKRNCVTVRWAGGMNTAEHDESLVLATPGCLWNYDHLFAILEADPYRLDK